MSGLASFGFRHQPQRRCLRPWNANGVAAVAMLRMQLQRGMHAPHLAHRWMANAGRWRFFCLRKPTIRPSCPGSDCTSSAGSLGW